jgi:hypothetical protein
MMFAVPKIEANALRRAEGVTSDRSRKLSVVADDFVEVLPALSSLKHCLSPGVFAQSLVPEVWPR